MLIFIPWSKFFYFIFGKLILSLYLCTNKTKQKLTSKTNNKIMVSYIIIFGILAIFIEDCLKGGGNNKKQ